MQQYPLNNLMVAISLHYICNFFFILIQIWTIFSTSTDNVENIQGNKTCFPPSLKYYIALLAWQLDDSIALNSDW